MHVITRKRLVEFGKGYPDAVIPLDNWYRIVKARRFANWAELRAVFGSADSVGNRIVVFNIGGNKYRLVTTVYYATATNMGRVYVRYVFTHAQYDRWSDHRRQQR
jgi:mRNA interferase HigB